MDNSELRKKIKDLGPWYQQVKFNDQVTAESSHSKLSGELAWTYIKSLIPFSIKNGARILDLGCNAGLHSIRCSKLLNCEVIGVENNNRYLKQAEFLKSYFNASKVTFIKYDLNKLSELNLGRFDLVLAISVLYWIGRSNVKKGHHYDLEYRLKEKEFIKYLCTITNLIMVRGRGGEYNNQEYYEELFKEFTFNCIISINETDSKRVLMLFCKEDI